MCVRERKRVRLPGGPFSSQRFYSLALCVSRLRLRMLGEPIVQFGEGPPDRRERLRELMGKIAGQHRRERE